MFNKCEKTKTCKNKCIFCFVDQLPKGLRKSLYVKDDDWQLSLLFGNYITFTNVTEKEINEIIKKKYSPLYISVHSVDNALRSMLLGHKKPIEVSVMDIIDRLTRGGIVLHGQIVLCPDINDGKYLSETIEKTYGKLRSLAVVPVGLTRYQENENVKPVTKEKAAEIINIVESYQKKYLKDGGERFVYCSDEFYLRAGLSLPSFDDYGDFSQIGNGVGLIAQFKQEFDSELEYITSESKKVRAREISLATGESAYPFIKDLCKKIEKAYPMLKINVYPVKNNFFGDTVTVAGLITGGDIIYAVNGKTLGECLYIPDVALRAEGDMFLDDMTPSELSTKLSVRVETVGASGMEFLEKVLDI